MNLSITYSVSYTESRIAEGRGYVHGGRIPWAHQLPQTHKNYNNYNYRTTININDVKTSRKDFPQLKIYQRNNNEMGMRANSWYSPDLNLWRTDPYGRGKLQLWKFSLEVRIWGPTLGFHAKGSCTRKKAPQNIWLWKASGLVFKRARVLQEREYLLLMDIYKISHILRPSTKAVIWKEPGSDSLDHLREPPQETRGN